MKLLVWSGTPQTIAVGRLFLADRTLPCIKNASGSVTVNYHESACRASVKEALPCVADGDIAGNNDIV
jgi:hypothetical protein